MRAALLSFCLVLVVGCKVENPNYCPDNQDNLCEQPDGGTTTCDDTSDCPMAEPVCRLSDHVCVQCAAGMTDACGTNTPVCNTTTNRCEACDSHADCTMSETCLPSGACADPADVLYVNGTTANTTTCDKANPCATVQAALAASATKSIIRVTGTVTAGTIALSSRDVTLIGDLVAPNMAKTSILRSMGGVDIMSIDGASKVRLYDLQLDQATGMDRSAIVIANTHNGELEVQRCVITDNYFGITNAGNSLVTLSRSVVKVNSHGGVILNGSNPKFDITNNFIFRNGGDTGSIQHSGITILGVNPGAPGRLEYNTIVDNDANGGGSRSGGVQCTMTSFAAPNNLIARNALDGNAGLPTSQVNGGCNFTNSVVQADLTNLAFVKADTSPYDYHLTTSSSNAIDKATGGAQLMIDVDGEKRPNGTARDIGADELYMQ